MPQDYYDPLQVLDHIHTLIDNNKASLGLRFVAYQDEELLPEYPAALVTMELPIAREQHATQMFLLRFNVDIWVFHARMSVGKAIRSRQDIELATNVRKLLHQNYTLDGHIVFGYVAAETPGATVRATERRSAQVLTTRLMWTGQNRVLYQNA